MAPDGKRGRGLQMKIDRIDAAGAMPAIARGNVDDAWGSFGDMRAGYDAQDRRAQTASAIAALAVHIALIAILSLSFSSRHTRTPPPPSMTVTMIDLPGPTNGSPDQDDHKESPRPAKPERPTPRQMDPDPVSAKDVAVAQPEEATPETPAQPSSQPTSVAGSPDGHPGGGGMAMGAKAGISSSGLDARLAASVGQAIATRVYACWDPPKGIAPGVSSTISVRYRPDGSLDSEPTIVRIVDERPVQISTPDPWERAAVDAVRRCSPVSMPAALYPYWQQVEIQIFNVG